MMIKTPILMPRQKYLEELGTCCALALDIRDHDSSSELELYTKFL